MNKQIVTGVAHVAVFCKDTARSCDFYTRVLGLEHLFTQKKPDGSLFYEYLHAGNRTFVELFPLDAAPPKPPHTGIAHMCLSVADINAAFAHIKSTGYPIRREPVMGTDGNWQMWLDDPDGVAIELMQMMPDCMQYKALARK
jgi:lactoylglutathione lyase